MSTDTSDEEALLTVEDAAAFLGVEVGWVYEHTRPASRDRLPCLKIGKYLRFDRRDLRAWVDERRAASLRAPRRR